MIMTLIGMCLFGFLVYLLITYIPMPPIFKTVITVVAVIICILWMIQLFGVADIPIPRVGRH